MRTALLSTLERTSGGSPRAFLSLGARTVLEWQVELAQALGAARFIFLAAGRHDVLESVRDDLRANGFETHVISGPMQLVSLLSADQELLVIGDGVVIDPTIVPREWAKKRVIAALPAQDGTAAGFERIDAQHAWGGLFVTRAHVAEQLADLPADSDTISLLLRLALQTGVPLAEVDANALESGELILARKQVELASRETEMLDRAAHAASWTGPGIALGYRIARLLAPAALSKGPVIAWGLAAILLVGGVALSWADWRNWALLSLAASAMSGTVGTALRHLGARLYGHRIEPGKERFGRYLWDIALITSIALPAISLDDSSAVFPPLVLVGVFRLAEAAAPRRWSPAFSDRALHAVILAACGFAGVLVPAIQLLALSALGLVLARGKGDGLTRV